MEKKKGRIRSFLQKVFDRDQDGRIQWAEVYLAVAGVFHRALVEVPRRRAAVRQQKEDLPVSRIREIPLLAGDIIYTPSSESTYYAGHMGILGTDGRVYHVHPFGPVFSDTVEWYVKRFYAGDRFIVFRAQDEGVGAEAAAWAEQHVHTVTAYRLNTGMDDIEHNYCSKFIDQAYRFTSGTDIWGKGKRKLRHGYLYPFQIVKSRQLHMVGSYYRE
ncbi:hypothetical protein SK066_04855 [Paenibacillus hunanensis]|uniref:hypothetical protein n=1 Tax=Paenibacillus hunanensis TaxID=539262 RepID=UPI002A6A8660|nr:hypothetical protein [Paenibacillus hunanensis]WPP42287.1 hypothetical protein SK066_04855 [Paenibacillus hunanensis]